MESFPAISSPLQSGHQHLWVWSCTEGFESNGSITGQGHSDLGCLVAVGALRCPTIDGSCILHCCSGGFWVAARVVFADPDGSHVATAGHLSLIAGGDFSSIISLHTAAVTFLGFVSRVPFFLLFDVFLAGCCSVIGHMPVFPSNHLFLPWSHLGRATAQRNMTLMPCLL